MTIPLPRTLQPSGNSDVARVTNALRSTSELMLEGGPFLFLSSASIGSASTRLRFQRGATITTSTGATTTIDGDIDAGPWQIFDGIGTVRFGPNAPRVVQAAWFGSGEAGLSKAFAALYAHGVVVSQPGGATISTNTSLGTMGDTLRVTSGSALRPAAGVTLTVNCIVDTPPGVEAFDLSLGGTAIVVPVTIAYLAPLSSTDNAPRVQAAAIAAGYAGKVVMLSGTWQWDTVCDLSNASGVTIEAQGPGTRIVSSLPPGPGASQCVFYAIAIALGPATTIATQPALGTRTLVCVDDVFSVGDWIRVVGATSVGQTFRILSKTGATLTLDDVVEFTFAVGKTVTAVQTPHDIRLFGNGAVITGTGDRAFEISAAQRCRVTGWRVTNESGFFTSIVCSFDIAGRDNIFDDMEVDGDGIAFGGLALENQVRSGIFRSRVRRVGSNGQGGGVLVSASRQFHVAHVDATASYLGISLGPSSVDDTEACRNGAVVDCSALDSTTSGLIVYGGAGIDIERFNGSRSGGTGAAFVVWDGVACVGAKLTDITVSDCGNAGLGVEAGGHLIAHGLTADRCAQYGINVNGAGANVHVVGYESRDGAGPWAITADSSLSIAQAYTATTTDNFWSAVLTAGKVSLDEYVGEKVGSHTGVKVLVGVSGVATLSLRRVRTIGAIDIGVGTAAVACLIRRGDDVDLSSCLTPWSIDAASRANFGQVALTGSTPVAVAGYFLADDPVALSFRTLGGTQGAQPVLTAKAANSFSVKGTSGDTSTYDWKAG
jgi:hypothetical protein